MAPRAVLFDLFDTLVDLLMESLPVLDVGGRRIPSTYGALHDVVLKRVGLDFESFARELGAVDREVVASALREGRECPTLERFRELLRRIGVDDPQLAEILTQTHMAKIRETASFLPHHPAVLRELRARVRLGICSNFSHAPTAKGLLEEAGLLAHLDTVAISEEIGIRKPRPEIFEWAMQQLGVSPEETLHVGDDLVADVSGAAALGITTIWVTRRVRNPGQALQEHKGPLPAHVIADLADIPELLRPLFG
jgi:HAD superfamily hydrolase (TIGR01509 family)